MYKICALCSINGDFYEYVVDKSEEDAWDNAFNSEDYGRCGDTLDAYELSEEEMIEYLQEADKELYDTMKDYKEWEELADKYFNWDLYNKRQEEYRKRIYGDDK